MLLRRQPYVLRRSIAAVRPGRLGLRVRVHPRGNGREREDGAASTADRHGPVERAIALVALLATVLALCAIQVEAKQSEAAGALGQAQRQREDILGETRQLRNLLSEAWELESRSALLRTASAQIAPSGRAPRPEAASDAAAVTETTQPPRALPTRRELEETIRRAAARHGLPGSWLVAQVTVESNWNPTAVSPTSDYGLAQIHLPQPGVTPDQALDPEFAADWLAATMARYFWKYGTFREALRRYQCGEEGASYFNCGAGYAQKVLELIPD